MIEPDPLAHPRPGRAFRRLVVAAAVLAVIVVATWAQVEPASGSSTSPSAR
jgi:hypothetical protein